MDTKEDMTYYDTVGIFSQEEVHALDLATQAFPNSQESLAACVNVIFSDALLMRQGFSLVTIPEESPMNPASK